jgi:UDP-3-O-[3-hydroxymyristoyl] glucosamine N-acyltransferase
MTDSDYTIQGQKSDSKSIRNVSSLHTGTRDDVSFCSSEEYKGMLSISQSNAGVILCKKSMEGWLVYPNHKEGQLLIFVDNPRLEFTRLAKRITHALPKVGISKSSVIADSAKIGRDCYIGDYVVIGDNCTVGNNAIIESKANLQNCIVGDNCSIQPNTTIGSDGFAFERAGNTLDLEKFPHYGKVVIENDVEIFANCSVARGSLSDTIIGQGTKIDALCHIAHNVNIGKNTELTAGTIVGGSTTIGNNCWLGLNSTIKNKIKIGDQVIVGSGSSVIYDVIDEDIVAGVPAKSIKKKVTANKEKLFLMAGQLKSDRMQ